MDYSSDYSRLNLSRLLSTKHSSPNMTLDLSRCLIHDKSFKRMNKSFSEAKLKQPFQKPISVKKDFKPRRLLVTPMESFDIAAKHRSLRKQRNSEMKSRLNTSATFPLVEASYESPDTPSVKRKIDQLRHAGTEKLLQNVRVPALKPRQHMSIEEIFDLKVRKSIGQSKLILKNMAGYNEAKSIIHATLNRRIRLIEAFVDASPNDKARVEIVNTTDQFGRSALHYVAFFGMKNAMQMLFTGGGDPRHIDMFGRTCLHYAALNDDKSIVEVIFQNLKTVRDTRNRACEVTNQNTVARKVKFLNLIKLIAKEEESVLIGRLEDFNELKVFVDLKELDEDITRALAKMEYSAEQPSHPQIKTEKSPFDSGRYIDLQDEMGRSALHIASMNGSARVVRTLLELGANPNLEDIQNQRALDLTRSREVTQLLLQKGNLVGANKSRPTTARNQKLEPSKKMDVRDLRIMPIEEIQSYCEGELQNSLLIRAVQTRDLEGEV
mmetsp:Transcript_3316/g.6860  ORF Transcript_3316/g.6860 Transcript_3316/m.6860 type:complete len:494 (-) Transcript_3316:1363-2844(-)